MTLYIKESEASRDFPFNAAPGLRKLDPHKKKSKKWTTHAFYQHLKKNKKIKKSFETGTNSRIAAREQSRLKPCENNISLHLLLAGIN